MCSGFQEPWLWLGWACFFPAELLKAFNALTYIVSLQGGAALSSLIRPLHLCIQEPSRGLVFGGTQPEKWCCYPWKPLKVLCVQIYFKTIRWFFILHLIRKQSRGSSTESMTELSYRTFRIEAQRNDWKAGTSLDLESKGLLSFTLGIRNERQRTLLSPGSMPGNKAARVKMDNERSWVAGRMAIAEWR